MQHNCHGRKNPESYRSKETVRIAECHPDISPCPVIVRVVNRSIFHKGSVIRIGSRGGSMAGLSSQFKTRQGYRYSLREINYRFPGINAKMATRTYSKPQLIGKVETIGGVSYRIITKY